MLTRVYWSYLRIESACVVMDYLKRIPLYYPRRVFMNFLWLLLSAAIILSINNINRLTKVMEMQF
jgi:hypothetical protein